MCWLKIIHGKKLDWAQTKHNHLKITRKGYKTDIECQVIPIHPFTEPTGSFQMLQPHLAFPEIRIHVENWDFHWMRQPNCAGVPAKLFSTLFTLEPSQANYSLIYNQFCCKCKEMTLECTIHYPGLGKPNHFRQKKPKGDSLARL